MPDLVERTRAYYQSVPADPWRWADDNSVIVWADGSTVAFREELCEILEKTPEAGLPPFRLIVLILAACRGKFPPSSEKGPPIREFAQPAQLDFAPTIPGKDESAWIKVWNDPANQEFSELLARLRALHQLAPHLKDSPRAKAVLIETILEGLTLERAQPAAELVRALRDLPLPVDLNSQENRLRQNADPYRLLRAGLQNFSPETLALRQRTGLDSLPGAAEVELRPSERARQLLALLRDDPEQQGLAKVARDIMAALYLPRALSELDELALGGFSDIANRGSLDRLLLSELANDDLTLAARVALNEALYIRREPPSNHPPSQLAILLDVGVRQWGLPRVFATAVALAFIAREERCSDVAIWRARRASVENADLLSRDGLVKHLSALETYAHPGSALKPFFAQFAKEPEMEAVLVAHRDSLSDPDFRRNLAEIEWKRFYIATVDRDGAFELITLPQGQKPLCQARISLDALFSTAPAKARASLHDARLNDLPLILSVKPFPFLLPVIGNIQISLALKSGGGVAVLSDRRLIRWEQGPGKGVRTLVDLLPPGRVLWLGTSDAGSKVHVLKLQTSSGMASLTSCDSNTGESTKAEFTLQNILPQEVYERDGMLFIIWPTKALAWNLAGAGSGGKVHLLPGSHFTNGRFYRTERGEWGFLAYVGESLRLTHLSLPNGLAGRYIQTMFDREGFRESGPWAVSVDGAIFSGDGDCVLKLGIRVRQAIFSRDGHQVLLAGDPGNDFRLIDLNRGYARKIQLPKEADLVRHAPGILEAIPVPPTCSVRMKFSEICITPDRQLMLRSTSGWSMISLFSKELRMIHLAKEESVPACAARFYPVATPPELNLRLRLAELPNGNKAWFDHRGLLHLKPGNSRDPELSIFLTDGPMAAWSSDGDFCGPPFFSPAAPNAEPSELKERIESFCRLV